MAEFVRTLTSRDVPFDRYLSGDAAALSPAAATGLSLFRGKAGCVGCHSGPMLADGGFHNLGLPVRPDIFTTPERHITLRRFFKTLGVSGYARLREDVGLYAITKDPRDRGRFRTPTLREVPRTAPYMHDGSLATLEDVVEFYDRGGGIGPGGDVVAFNTLCTHQGGSLRHAFDGEHRVAGPCPLHLSTFDLTRHGIVVAGHGTESLPQVVLEARGDEIWAIGVLGLIYGYPDNLAFVGRA